MTSIGGIGWSPRLGSEKSQYVHGWIVVYQKPGVGVGWRIHTDCPRLEGLTGMCVWGDVWECVCVCTFIYLFVCFFTVCLFAREVIT